MLPLQPQSPSLLVSLSVFLLAACVLLTISGAVAPDLNGMRYILLQGPPSSVLTDAGEQEEVFFGDPIVLPVPTLLVCTCRR